MKWDSVYSESHVPFFPAIITQISTCIGVLLFEDGKSIFYKLFIGFLSAFIFNFFTSPIWKKLSFLSIPGLKDNLTIKSKKEKLIFPTKFKTLLRLILGSIFTLLSSSFFLYSRGNSSISNCMVFIFMKLLLCSLTGNIKTTKLGRFISCTLFISSILIVAVSSKMKIIYLILSFLNSWLSLTYSRSMILSVLLGTSLLSLLCGFYFERSSFQLNILKSLIGGCLIWATPNYYILMKKNIKEKLIVASFTIFPFIFTFILHFTILRDSQLPLSLYMSVILSFLGGRFFNFSIPEFPIFRPFSTTRSVIHTIFSIYLVFHSVYNYWLFYKTSRIFLCAESLYFLFNLVYSMSEFFYVIQRTSSEQFTFGYSRLSSIFSFSISVLTVMTEILILSRIFQLKDSVRPFSFKYSIPSLFCHIFLIVFLSWSRNSIHANRSQSIRNAVNLNSAPSFTEDEPKQSASTLPLDICFLFLAVLGGFSQNCMFDRLISIFMLVIISLLVVPVLRASLIILMQFTPQHILQRYSAIMNEIKQCPCVVDVKYMNFWQNDAALTVATIRVKIDEKQCEKPQEFLRFVISLCHQNGVLDVTVEIVNCEEQIVIAMIPHNPYRRNSTIL